MGMTPEEVEKGINDLKAKILSLEGTLAQAKVDKGADPKELEKVRTELHDARQELKALKDRMDKVPDPHKPEPAPAPAPAPKAKEEEPVSFGFYDL